MIGDLIDGEDLERALQWSGGELAWEADGLAVIRAVYG